jgi:glycolate oxidase iron-sulfur subunit
MTTPPDVTRAALGTDLPDGTRYIGPEPGAEPRWPFPDDAPTNADLSSCVACGLCLPHCPTYRLTGEESASPRGRIAAMRAVDEGVAVADETFAGFMDLCLACRACEDVCPSHVPFGRMVEHARVQIEPLRSRRERLLRRLGLDIALRSKKLLWLAAALQPIGVAMMPKRVRALVPRRTELFRRLPRKVRPRGKAKGTVALLSGCVQDRWYRHVNRATIRVLSRNGWRVVVPRRQRCCGALAAHHGRLGTARRLAERNVRAFAKADVVVANAAGCGAHLKDVGDLLGTDDAREFSAKIRDVMEFLAREGFERPSSDAGAARVAYHDACHALRVQKIREQPRAVLRTIPGLEVVDVPDGDMCCGAAGLYGILEPGMSSELRRLKTESVLATNAKIVASANPGCTMQIAAGLRELGTADVRVVHPVELLARAYAAEGRSS